MRHSSTTLKQLTLLLLLVLLLAQCQVRPSGVLAREKMKAVLRDITLTESYLDSHYEPDSIRTLYYESVYDKHGITRATYDSSLVWYAKNTPLLNDLYSELMTEFQAGATALDSAIVDSTRLYRVRYQPPESLWEAPSRIVIPGDRRLYALTQYVSNVSGGDTLDLTLRLTPLDSLQELHFILVAKDTLNHVTYRTEHTTPPFVTRDSHKIILPDSLSSTDLLHLRMLYLSRHDTTGHTTYPPLILDSIALALRQPIELPADSLEADPTTEHSPGLSSEETLIEE